MKKKQTGVILMLAALSLMSIQPVEACTRAVYLGPEQLVITGRTMDWKEDIMSNIYVFPRGIQRVGHNKEKTVNWTSKYGSVIATGYDIGTCDGMNEKGLVASLLFLPESIYSLPGDIRPAMGISIWTQYVLDNFATVREAVDELKKETFRIDAPRMPNGGPESTLHMAITDETGNTAVLEYLDGKLSIHEGKEYQVMTNSPRYEYQLAINDYWKEVGGLQMLPGTNRSSDRFVRASFYIHAIPQTADAKIAVPSVLSVMPVSYTHLYNKERATYDESVDYICNELEIAANYIPYYSMQEIHWYSSAHLPQDVYKRQGMNVERGTDKTVARTVRSRQHLQSADFFPVIVDS